MSTTEMVALAASGLLLSATAVLSIAGRSLNRLQRRAWVSGEPDQPGEGEESLAEAVESVFVAVALARQLALILLIVEATVLLHRAQPGSKAVAVMSVAVGLYLLFDKLLPYLVLVALGGSRVLRIGRPLFIVERFLFGAFARLLGRMLVRSRARDLRSGPGDERSDLGDFIDFAEEEGMVTESEEALLRGVADFEEAVVREVMTPRVDIIAIDSDATLSDLRKVIVEHRLSRIPVMERDLDHVVGIAHLKDLVAQLEQDNEAEPISSIARPAWFVPETKRVNELLDEFQSRQIQLAIVVDEYGGTAGLVTLEDAVEEIVGEIQDEDEVPPTLIERHDDHVVASGKAEIEELEEALGVMVPEGDFHTVGGMVFSHFGHVPAVGDQLKVRGLRIEVLEADERRIHRVRISSR